MTSVTTTVNRSDQNLWDFALEFYAHPEVSSTCLLLQDQYNVNVCLLLGLCWLDAKNYSLSHEEYVELTAYIHPWTTDVIEPLRLMRRTLKLPFMNFALDESQLQLRNTIKQAELLAEKKVLLEIEAWIRQQTRSLDVTAASSNVEHYLREKFAPGELLAVLMELLKKMR